MFKFCKYLIIILLLAVNCKVKGQKIKLGAYYFDGWSGIDSTHITKRLLSKKFAFRKPVWGWITSKQNIIDAQLLTASHSGISFFAFCWYYASADNLKGTALNNALKLYNSSKVMNKIDYCLMIANHSGFLINTKNWSEVMNEWLTMFRSERYVKVNNKPLLIFYSLPSLIKEFGGIENVRSAFSQLRQLALSNDLNGVTISVCVKPIPSQIDDAEKCGVELLTGYNYHEYGYSGSSQEIPIEKLQEAELNVWDKISTLTRIKYMPAITLNWDPRPWANKSNDYSTQHYYSGFFD